MNLSNEVIALIIALITTVLVPFLNKKFGNNPVVGEVAKVVVDELEKQTKGPFDSLPTHVPSPGPQPVPLPTPVTPTPPAATPENTFTIPPNEDGAM